ncbi:MAG: hypothetical protein RMJ55_09215 [Roseiflexaceae bacterium]|nr:hypothetical protein [Roseiflexaceae bacterium]
MLAALNLLSESHGRRIAILGDMLELGSIEEEAHRMIRSARGGSCADPDYGRSAGAVDRRGGASGRDVARSRA